MTRIICPILLAILSCTPMLAARVLADEVKADPQSEKELRYLGKPGSYWILKLNGSAHERKQAIEALVTLGADKAETVVPLLVKALDDDDVDVRWASLRAIGKFGAKAKIAVPAILRATKDRNVEFRTTAFEVLGRTQPEDKATLAALARGLNDEILDVRFEALDAISTLAPDCIKASASEMVLALKRTPRPSHPDWSTFQERIISVIATLGADAVPILLDLLESKNKDGHHFVDRVDVVRALGGLGPVAGKAIPTLTALCQVDDERLRWAAEEALEKINKK